MSIPLNTPVGTHVVCIKDLWAGTASDVKALSPSYPKVGEICVVKAVVASRRCPSRSGVKCEGYEKFRYCVSAFRLAVLPRSLTSLLETKSIDDLISEAT